ncbi:hypothetical protein D9756_009520 [Leucocoprinus leucothites]|uniref:Uncharacterized protein n=1 Tax=Leucocoprinus leucothites TaxID=201217 RepID=A0A8H5CY54_9AGAR|nr:hypothetical protein D9756_009520 [Leucoagaricus leucothites]
MKKIPLQEAMDWLGDYCDELVDSFLVNLKSVPSWGAEVDRRASVYINGLGQWVRGIDGWHFESTRYFGSEAPIVKQTRIATLIPSSRGYVVREDEAPMTHLRVVMLIKSLLEAFRNIFVLFSAYDESKEPWNKPLSATGHQWRQPAPRRT